MSEMLRGVVKWFNDAKGFGFIEHESGKDVFVHYSVIDTQGFKTLKDGEEVQYELRAGDKGLSASRVVRVATVSSDLVACDTPSNEMRPLASGNGVPISESIIAETIVSDNGTKDSGLRSQVFGATRDEDGVSISESESFDEERGEGDRAELSASDLASQSRMVSS